MAIESNQSGMNAQPALNGIGYSELALVHTTSYRPGLDKDGNLEIKSSFEGAGGFNQKPDPSIEDSKSPFGVGMRPTVHFSLQEPVTDHAYGSFEGREYTVYAPLQQAIEKNGAPEAVMSADTSFFAPESSVKLPGAVLVKVDAGKELAADTFAQHKDGMMVIAQELNDNNRANAITLLKAAEQRNPGLGAGEMAVYAETANGPRASAEVSKALALNEIGAPTLNKAIDFKYEGNVGFDGWATHANTQQFVQELPVPQQTRDHIHVGRHDGSAADKLNSAFRRGNHAEMQDVASAEKNPTIASFAEKLNSSELMSKVRDNLILQELANKDYKTFDSMGASSNGMARTIYAGERSFESDKLGTVTPLQADKALTRASDQQLDLISTALLSRDVNGPEGNKGDQKLFDQVDSAKQMNAITKEFMPKERNHIMSKEMYTLVKAADNSREQFGDAKSAAEAFSKANGADKPSVVKTVQGKGAEFVAGTSEIKAATGKDFSKYVGHTDKEFREEWNKAEMGREKGDHALEAAAREKSAAQVDMSKLENAEIGKTYRGPILAVTGELIVQRHTDEKSGKQVDIAHKKENVFNYAEKPESIGKSHQIAYPHSKSGFARELQPSELQKAPEKAAAPQHEANKSSSMERGR